GAGVRCGLGREPLRTCLIIGVFEHSTNDKKWFLDVSSGMRRLSLTPSFSWVAGVWTELLNRFSGFSAAFAGSPSGKPLKRLVLCPRGPTQLKLGVNGSASCGELSNS